MTFPSARRRGRGVRGGSARATPIDREPSATPGDPRSITHFTPKQKRRVREEGFSFMSMLPPAAVGAGAAGAAAGAARGPDDPNQQASSNLPLDLLPIRQVGLAGVPFLPINCRGPYARHSVRRGAPRELRCVPPPPRPCAA